MQVHFIVDTFNAHHAQALSPVTKASFAHVWFLYVYSPSCPSPAALVHCPVCMYHPLLMIVFCNTPHSVMNGPSLLRLEASMIFTCAVSLSGTPFMYLPMFFGMLF